MGGGGGPITCRLCTKATEDDIGILARSCSAKIPSAEGVEPELKPRHGAGVDTI
jgi:hypothetical protein